AGARGVGGQAVRVAVHDPAAAAHGDAIGTTKDRFVINVDDIIDEVLGREIASRGPDCSVSLQCHGERLYVATGAKGSVRISVQHDAGDVISLTPLEKLAFHRLQHIQVEGIKGTWIIEP